MDRNWLKIFKAAAASVPAYKRLLKARGILPQSIKNAADFLKLPIIDKKSYVYRYPHKDIFPQGKAPDIAYASSGSSGKPTFWFRGEAQEKAAGILHERIFRDIFDIEKNEPTLVAICFSMGVWVAGNYTFAACREVARKGYALTIVSPGIEKEDIFHVLQRLAPRFKRLILAGYPPFLMDILHEAHERKIKLPAGVKVLTAGDKFSEEWRTAFLKQLGSHDPYHSLVGIYGSADAGVLGHETPLSIFLRRKSAALPALHAELFGADHVGEMPGLAAYDPSHIHFEAIKGELVFTADTAAPLVRYNIHDTGRVVDTAEVGRILKKYGFEKEARKLGLLRNMRPLVVVSGRTDVATTLYALNIYPEHIRRGVEDPRIRKYLSGNYFAYHKNSTDHKTQKLYIDLELAPRIASSKRIAHIAARCIYENLLAVNIEYRKLQSAIGDKVRPVIVLSPSGASHFDRKAHGLLNLKGKKPKMVL